MSTAETAQARAYDNNGQYSRKSILRYEKIFGDGYISTGGPGTTDYLCKTLGSALRPGLRVLDVGSGIGGAAIHLARTYGADVVGLDLAPEMVQIALERASELDSDGPGAVAFILGDILEESFAHPFDLIWSRDALMHIPDKPRLFARLFDLLDDGGQIIITDYARGEGTTTPEFAEYVRKTGYHLVSPSQYGRLLEGAGFVDVEVEDATARFVEIMRTEAAHLAADRAGFLEVFSEDDLNYLIDRWAMKEQFCAAGDMKWGIYRAFKRS